MCSRSAQFDASLTAVDYCTRARSTAPRRLAPLEYPFAALRLASHTYEERHTTSSTRPTARSPSRCGAEACALVRKMLFRQHLWMPRLCTTDPPHWPMRKTGWRLAPAHLLLLVGASRRSTVGACLAVSSAPLLYRGITGRWPDVLNGYCPARQYEERSWRRSRRPRPGIDSAGGARRRRLPVLASPRESAAVHDTPRPCDRGL